MVFLGAGATLGLHKLVVLGLDFFIRDGVLLFKFGEKVTDQNALFGHFELFFVIGRGVHALFHGFLNEDFAGHDLFFDLAFDFGRDLAARFGHLGRQSVGP